MFAQTLFYIVVLLVTENKNVQAVLGTSCIRVIHDPHPPPPDFPRFVKKNIK